MTELRIKILTGDQIHSVLQELADLRIEVFKEYPYLYDGSAEYEENYLKCYADCGESLVVAVFSEDLLVGASTGLPMVYAADEFKVRFVNRGYDIGKIFYFGESVMKKNYRGKGVYARFFQERETYAGAFNRFDLTTFCAVERSENHARRPPLYRPLDEYWEKRGYEKQPQLATRFLWKDLDETEESPKLMVFWTKSIH